LESELPTPGPTLHGNANQLQQVLTNLVTNAWEAGRDTRCPIRLTVQTVAFADIPTANRFPVDYQPQNSAYACLAVADSGCGIADQDLEKLFDPFFSRKLIGRGLGLPVALGIVKAHGGVITVESEPGRGSVFRVFIPLSTETAPRNPVTMGPAPIRSASSVSVGHPQAGTMLVVEDEPVVRQTATLALQRLGFTVLAAEDGVQAVEVFRQHQDEVIGVLCDLTMPRMNGWDTLTALRRLAPGLPVILTSGYSEAQAREGDHPELPQAFLRKPYEYGALANTVNQVLAKRIP
jgi:CheY-like chemotaxis protein